MNSRMALLFPGQGAYVPGVFASLSDEYPQINTVLEIVDKVSREYSRSRVSTLLIDTAAPSVDELVSGDPARLHLAIYASSIALYRVLTEVHGVRADVLAGHSFGEIAALTAAGAFDVLDGARLVAERDAMLEQGESVRGGLLGLRMGHARTAALITAAGGWRTVVAAENSPTQTVVSGPDGELAVLEAMAQAADVLARRLRATYPFHNPMLQHVAEAYGQKISDIAPRAPRVRTFSPISGRYYEPQDDLRAAVASHLVRPVRFNDAVRALFADGVDTYVESGARSILVDLAGQNLPGLRTHAPLRRRASVAEFSAAVAEIQSAAAPAPAVVPAPRESSVVVTALPPMAELTDLLRHEYATALDYPPDVFTDDADLEADLGIDSIKQTEMLARLRERFSLPPVEGVRITAYRTLPEVAGLLNQLAARKPAPAAS